jgi:CheY-like chemotaxis protein
MFPTEPRRILVVDDDPVVCGLMVVGMEGSRCRVETVRDGEAAWGALLANDYDLLVTDDTESRSAGLASERRIRIMSCLDCLQS